MNEFLNSNYTLIEAIMSLPNINLKALDIKDLQDLLQTFGKLTSTKGKKIASDIEKEIYARVKKEAVKYPHSMYDPETGKETIAKTPEDHKKYAAKGYTHEQPKTVSEQRLGKMASLAIGHECSPNFIQSLSNEIFTISEIRKAYKNFLLEEELKFKPPAGAVNAAKKAIEWKDKYGDEVTAMTQTGWVRARQLANGDELSLDIVKRMAGFNRHRKNSKISPENKDTPWKDNGHVAWLGWGGDAGIDWAMKISDQYQE